MKVHFSLTVPTLLQYYWSLDVEGASLSHEEGQMATIPSGILQGGRTSVLTVTVLADDPEIMGTVSLCPSTSLKITVISLITVVRFA